MNQETPDYLTTSETAAITRLTVGALAQLRSRGQGPAYIKPTRRKVLYRRADVIAWLETTRRDLNKVA